MHTIQNQPNRIHTIVSVGGTKLIYLSLRFLLALNMYAYQ